MSEEQYAAYVERSVPQFAEESLIAGASKESDAEARSRDVFEQSLPNGIHTPNHHLYVIRDAETQTTIGTTWLMITERPERVSAFICDIFIFPEWRSKGHGANTMRLLEIKAREQFSATEIGLHVFCHNRSAQSFYSKVGYQPTGLIMKKFLNVSDQGDR